MPPPRNDIKAIRANDVYRALPLNLAIDLQKLCAASGENPAAVLADALMLHLDELSAARFDPAAIVPQVQAAGVPA